MDLATNLLKRAEKYAKAHKISLSTLGNRAVNNARVFTRMRDSGGACSIATYQAITDWLDEQESKVGKAKK